MKKEREESSAAARRRTKRTPGRKIKPKAQTDEQPGIPPAAIHCDEEILRWQTESDAKNRRASAGSDRFAGRLRKNPRFCRVMKLDLLINPPPQAKVLVEAEMFSCGYPGRPLLHQAFVPNLEFHPGPPSSVPTAAENLSLPG